MLIKKDLKQQISDNKNNKNLLKPLVIAIAVSFTSGIPNITQAQHFTVSSLSNGGLNSLRQAIFFANSNSEADTISFDVPPGSTINLTSELVISDSITITGPTAGDPNSIILNAGSNSRVINADTLDSTDTLILENMTLREGNTASNISHDGGALLIGDGDVTLNHCLIANNQAYYLDPVFLEEVQTYGGGIKMNDGNLTINHSIISNNQSTARGGGIDFHGDELIINQSIISNNAASTSASIISVRGGGLNVSSGNLTLNSSSVSNNRVASFFQETRGGGIYQLFNNITLNNSTIANNTAYFGDAGGIWAGDFVGNLTLNQSTISGNSAGFSNFSAGGIRQSSGLLNANQSTIVNNYGRGTALLAFGDTEVTLTNSILSGNSGQYGNFIGQFYVGGFLTVNTSMFGDPVGEITNNNSAYLSDTPDLGILQHNGGITKTHKPNATSYTVNTGNSTASAAFSVDQRGTNFKRIHGTSVDMGAVELQNIDHPLAPSPLNPGELLTRRDMAREVLKEINGSSFTPSPIISAAYDDVQIGDINADWINKFKLDGYTEGCAANKFCPDSFVAREDMAKVFLQAFYEDVDHTPNPSVNTFNDVTLSDHNGEWITELRDLGYTIGCNDLGTLFCPKQPVTRKWFEYLLSKL